MNNYIVYHLHTFYGNGIMTDSATDYTEYIKRAKELNMSSIAFSEHGNVYNWIHKKMKCDELGIKYIHGQEFYLTTSLNMEDRVRENFHIGLYARNWEGVKEINRLSSIAFNKDNGHYYYRPRISLDELFNTSSNIIVTSACLASLLWSKRDNEVSAKLLEWMALNKDRCFLEIQYHSVEEQKEYNKLLYEWSKKYDLKLIAGTDTHALNAEDMKLRHILQKSKKINFEQEDEFDLTFKTYDELVEKFKVQNCLPEKVYLEAINNTNHFDSLVDNFELDMSHKYPKISDNAEPELQKRINDGILRRKVNKWEKEKKREYYARIKEEFDIFKQLNMFDYIILLDDIIRFCKENNIAYAPRGSCNGSLILWALEVTDIDSIKFNLPFFRFCNPERVSLGDVDIDMAGFKRSLVKDFLYNYKGIEGSAIITYQRYALRGAIKAIGRGLEIPLSEIEIISQDIDEIVEEDESGEEVKRTTFHNKEKWEKQYPELLYWANKSIGVVENVSTHACGFVATDRSIAEEIGYFKTDKCQWIISQNDMKAIDAVNFVKMDLLVVDNVQIADDVCRLANIPVLKNDELDFEDMNVWNEMLKSGLGIFQFEKTGWRYLKSTLDNFEKFKEQVKDISRLDVMSALNGIIRPVGDSIREDFVQGKPYHSGMKEIDEFLGDSLGYLIYQEQIMMWLYNFCNYSMGQSDIVRRGIAKKKGTEKLIPKIEEGFMKYCTEKFPHYDESHLREVMQKFIQVILDASDYGFSINHSTPYSILGFKGAYLRHYYPLQFLTVQFNINQGVIDKTTKIQEFVDKHTDIKVNPIKFGKSKSEYNCDVEGNAIYKGIKSIKFLSEKNADELYQLKDNNYESFVDLLIDVEEKTSVNTKQMNILIKLNFFDTFGKNKKLLNIYNEFVEGKNRYNKTHTQKTKEKRIVLLREMQKFIIDESITMYEQLLFEKEMLGFPISTFDVNKKEVIALEVDTKYAPKILFYSLHNGKTEVFKIDKRTYKKNIIKVGSIVRVDNYLSKQKTKKTDNGFEPVPNQFDWWITDYKIIN